LAEEANTEPNRADRQALYGEIQEAIVNAHAVMPLDYQPFVWAMSRSVAGLEVESAGIPWFGNTGFTE